MKGRIRRAQGADWAICRALVPEACGRTDCPIEGLILHPESGPRVGGAAVLRFDGHDAWLGLRVVPPVRRQGLGSYVFEAAVEAARAGGARRMVTAYDTLAEPGAQPFLEKHGFEAVTRITTFEANFPATAQILGRMRDELVARHRVPAGWVITTLARAPLEAVAQLFAAYVAQREDLAEAPLRLDREAGRWDRSPVILENGRPVGALITEKLGNVWKVEGRFVVRGYQSGVANAILLGAAVDLGMAHQASHFRFESRDDNRDTLKLARRMNARPLRVRTRFELALY
ncbi:GNAT family N-acetyltransferase [Paludibaculum fermentans]|uniref:GNAT family N-acetyltransferase n=1 Tax=Paludibaculum fermentans TaxID=1473598 RepID=UPI003EBA3E8C